MGILHSMKRIVSQLFEREYWYAFRKLTDLWYDSGSKKWIVSANKRRALSVMNSTWNGDYDMLETMLLKVDHMFWNLHKRSFEKQYYFYASDVIEHGSDGDKDYILRKLFEGMTQNESDNEVWLFDAECSEDLSADCKLHLHLSYDKENRVFNIVAKSKRAMTDEEEQRWKSFRLEGGKFVRDTRKHYRTLNSTCLDSWIVPVGMKPEYFAVRFLPEKIEQAKWNVGIFEVEASELLEGMSFKELMLRKLDTSPAACVDLEIEDMPKLSTELKKHAAGSFVKCRNLLQTRHLLKKAIRYCDDSLVCSKDWAQIEDEDKRTEAILAARDKFAASRKEAFINLATYLADVGMNLWD